MIAWIVVGTVLQLAMVLAGHWSAGVAQLFAPLGMAISLVVGLLWARRQARGRGHAAGGGAVVGGVCAFIGIIVSLALGDVAALVLAFGTVSSAVTGALGGLVGGWRRSAAAAA
jgi:hypothetical protein